MLAKPRFCTQCGAAVHSQVRDGQPRDVCTACGTVVYQNPPALAAGVVLNERREVLMVKCRRGRKEAVWCLPMDYVETGEALAAAVQRALKRKTGIDAHAVRLLDAESSPGEDERDLLVVSLEMKKTAGTEQPGPDTDEVGYFPLSRHPELALPANERALRICAEAHQEEWMIRDSFEHADEIARAWLAEVWESPTTASYRRLDQRELLEKAVTGLSQFSRWLSGTEADREVSDFYFAVGRERRKQGFDVHELFSILTLLKKHLWIFAHEHGLWERPIDAYRALELSRRFAEFFDKVIYHALRGFEAEKVP
jgi:ADP-ribose pyrophosphatase YjhB (NUDIX family)